MLDHIGLPVSDFVRSRAFYVAALAPLGIHIVREFELPDDGGGPGGYAGFGSDRPQFWIGTGQVLTGRLHIAFAARDREAVRAFYAAAIAASGRDNGPPGLRPHYHENYFGAFVLDPDGHNVEAVCHLPD